MRVEPRHRRLAPVDRAVEQEAAATLRDALRGEVLAPGDTGYDEARAV
jgi:hypothetical protein